MKRIPAFRRSVTRREGGLKWPTFKSLMAFMDDHHLQMLIYSDYIVVAELTLKAAAVEERGDERNRQKAHGHQERYAVRHE